MTNDELMQMYDKVDFLKWLSAESFSPVGAEESELVKVAQRWNEFRKQRMMDKLAEQLSSTAS